MQIRSYRSFVWTARGEANTSALFVGAYLAFLLIGTVISYAQTAQTAQPSPSTSIDANDWRRVPVAAHSHPDTATNSKDRDSRDNYWTRISPPPPPNGGHITVSGALVDPRGPEIIPITGSFWAIGTFLSYDVYEAPSGSIYTEIHIRIDRFIGPATDSSPHQGQVIDVGIPGGSIAKSSTVKHEHIRQLAHQYELQPDKRYLLQLLRVPGEQFYQAQDYWEISDGLITPVSMRDKLIARNGASHLAGLRETDAVTYIQLTLSK
jgi:hypothetical protein